MDDILKEPVPPEVNEQAYEVVAEELKVAQVNVLNKNWSVCVTFIIKWVLAWNTSPSPNIFEFAWETEALDEYLRPH